MSTALAKHCDWSLGFDERGPVFDETQDWRHSTFLTGRAARKGVYFASESPENQRFLLAAMAREWKKWREHKATLPLMQGELRMLKYSPTGSRDSFFLVLSCAAQEHWSCGSADAASACLHARRIERLLLLMMPKRQPPPGCEPGEVSVARGSIFGTRDASRSWYQHFRDRLANKFRVHESALEKGLYLNEFSGRLTFVTVTHVDDSFYAHDTRCKTTKSLLDAIVKEFNMSRKQDDFVFCGRRVRVTPEDLIVSQERAASSLTPMCGTQRSPETILSYSEHR